MSALDVNDIYTGHWVDWSRGEVRGQLLTLHNRYARILIVFLALFVWFTGYRTWSKYPKSSETSY